MRPLVAMKDKVLILLITKAEKQGNGHLSCSTHLKSQATECGQRRISVIFFQRDLSLKSDVCRAPKSHEILMFVYEKASKQYRYVTKLNRTHYSGLQLEQ